MRDLYISDYPYVLYSAIVKGFSEPDRKKDLLIANGILGLEKLIIPLEESGVFEKVFFYDDLPFRTYVSKICSFQATYESAKGLARINALIKGFLRILSCAWRYNNIKFPFEIDFRSYSTIYYTDRIGTMMFYLNSSRIKYTAMEHGKNVWSKKSKGAIYYLKLIYLLEKFRICCGISAYSAACNAVLVSDSSIAKDTPPWATTVEWDLDKCIEALSNAQKDAIFTIYTSAYDLKLDFNNDYAVLLTNPLCADSVVNNEKEQIEFYMKHMAQYFPNIAHWIIKPHPRDTVNYEASFPNATIIDKEISAEVLCLSSDLRILGVLTYFSSAIEFFKLKTNNLYTISELYWRTNKEKV